MFYRSTAGFWALLLTGAAALPAFSSPGTLKSSTPLPPSRDAFYSGPFPEIGLALGQGWYVNVPDLEGPLASNIANIEQAHATLDSLRAVLSSDLGLAPGVRCALWGYSGGSMPSEWALEFHRQYAPELNISGAALGGLVPNATASVVLVGGTIWASHAISGILGIVS